MTDDNRQEQASGSGGADDIAAPILPAPAIYALGLGIGVLIDWGTGLELFPSRTLAFAVGWPIVGISVALTVWAASVMRQARESPDPRVPTKAIVRTGPFHFSRNPMYLAFTVGYVGLAFALNSGWPLVLSPAVIVAMHFGVILREERYLERRLGQAYRDYRGEVRRWL